jgi:hypothetical protein
MGRGHAIGRGVVERVVAGVAALTLLLGVSACAQQHSGPGGDFFGEGAQALPFETAQDWVTYADYVVEVTVISERPIPTAPSSFPATAKGRPPAAGPRDVAGREVTATTSSPPVWTRPSLIPTRLLPASITIAGGGWEARGDEKARTSSGQHRPEVGRHYLAASTYADVSLAGGDGRGPTEWLTLELLTFDNGVVGDAPTASGDSWPTSLEGKHAAEVAAILAQTPADPAAAPYMDEDPVQRFQDVARDTQPRGTPGPGEY